MQTNIHLNDGETHQAFTAESNEVYTALEIIESGDGFSNSKVVAFVSTVEQAQQLVEAAVAIRFALREQRTQRVHAELTPPLPS